MVRRRGRPATLTEPRKVSFWLEQRDLDFVRRHNLMPHDVFLSGLNRQISTMLAIMTDEELKATVSINNRKITWYEQEIEELVRFNESLALLYDVKKRAKEEMILNHPCLTTHARRDES